jgi:quercetin dioxygenase-like cupin family protein
MPEARAVVIDLAEGEQLRDHQVRERAVLQVLAGSADCAAGGDNVTCGQGTLVLFEPGETHSVHALEATRLLLTLAPWPAPGHYADAEAEDPHALPIHATIAPREGS